MQYAIKNCHCKRTKKLNEKVYGNVTAEENYLEIEINAQI